MKWLEERDLLWKRNQRSGWEYLAGIVSYLLLIMLIIGMTLVVIAAIN